MWNSLFYVLQRKNKEEKWLKLSTSAFEIMIKITKITTIIFQNESKNITVPINRNDLGSFFGDQD